MRYEGFIHRKGNIAVTIENKEKKQFYCYLYDIIHLNVEFLIENKIPITFNIDKNHIYGYNIGFPRYLAYNIKIKKTYFNNKK